VGALSREQRISARGWWSPLFSGLVADSSHFRGSMRKTAHKPACLSSPRRNSSKPGQLRRCSQTTVGSEARGCRRRAQYHLDSIDSVQAKTKKAKATCQESDQIVRALVLSSRTGHSAWKPINHLFSAHMSLSAVLDRVAWCPTWPNRIATWLRPSATSSPNSTNCGQTGPEETEQQTNTASTTRRGTRLEYPRGLQDQYNTLRARGGRLAGRKKCAPGGRQLAAQQAAAAAAAQVAANNKNNSNGKTTGTTVHKTTNTTTKKPAICGGHERRLGVPSKDRTASSIASERLGRRTHAQGCDIMTARNTSPCRRGQRHHQEHQSHRPGLGGIHLPEGQRWQHLLLRAPVIDQGRHQGGVHVDAGEVIDMQAIRAMPAAARCICTLRSIRRWSSGRSVPNADEVPLEPTRSVGFEKPALDMISRPSSPRLRQWPILRTASRSPGEPSRFRRCRCEDLVVGALPGSLSISATSSCLFSAARIRRSTLR